jgi:hypothetical protein
MQAFTAGPAPPSGGSGFAANGFPWAAPLPTPFSPSTTPPADGVGRQGLLPWGWLGFRGFRPVRRWSLNRAVWREHVGGPDAPGRAARRSDGGAAGAPPLALPLGISQRLKEGDDAPGVIALWLTRAAGPACQRHGGDARLVGCGARLAGP